MFVLPMNRTSMNIFIGKILSTQTKQKPLGPSEGCHVAVGTDQIRFLGHAVAGVGRDGMQRLDRWSAETEILLFTASRRDHLEKTINPALVQGQTVISDRFADSTRVYQGATRGDLRAMVDQLHRLMIGREPDLTFIIDMDPATALKRGLARSSGEDRFEDFGLSFQETLRHGFLALAHADPKRCIVIDGNRTVDQIASEIAAYA